MDTPHADQLQFNDRASCKRWIAALPLTNVESSQQALTRQVSLLRQTALAPLALLLILESLREPVAFLQDELSRKYIGKPQPLEPAEAAWWTCVTELWQEFIAAYGMCREAYVGGDPALRNHGALIVTRCLRYTSSAMLEHYRAYRQAPGELWHHLHQLYAFAEQAGFARTMVVAAFNHQEADSSCATIYRQALLVHLANPFTLSARQLEVLARWSANWAGLVNLAATPPTPSTIPALAVDFAGDRGPVLAASLEPRASLRYLDLEVLARTLRRLITLLKQGQAPTQVGLGANISQPGCGDLLMLLYIQWCRAGMGRGEQRAPLAEDAQVRFGMRAAHSHIDDRSRRLPASNQGVAADSWQLVNRSSSGFMCMARGLDAGTRISHNQLVCVDHGSGKSPFLGLVQWLRVTDNHRLLTGVRLFPGNAHAIGVRPAVSNDNPDLNGYERGLLLPEQPARSAPATLILPSGWYQPDRPIELRGDQKQVVKLGELLETGSDFERCTFTVDQNP